MPPPAESTTGRWLPLYSVRNGSELAAALFLAKDDTHFRRVGCWGLRPECAGAVPADLLPLLQRARAGELHV